MNALRSPYFGVTRNMCASQKNAINQVDGLYFRKPSPSVTNLSS